jgi:hypothetical protein
MKADNAMEMIAVVTLNLAMVMRTQTISYRMLHNPEAIKKTKYTCRFDIRPAHASPVDFVIVTSEAVMCK